MRTKLFAAALLISGAMTFPGHADAVADFYRGKTVNMIISYGPGGGYDTYARILAIHMGRHIPGNPTVITQNIPGAGSLKGANYIYNVAPKDGTAFGTFARTLAVLGLMKTDQNVQFDPRKFTWLGSSSSYANDAYALLVRKDASVTTVEGMRKPGGTPLILGSTAEGASSDAMQNVLIDMLGFNIKAIPGYTDSSQLFMAIERGEIEGRTVGLSAIRSNKPDWIKPGGPMKVVMVFARQTRHEDFPDAPTARELALTPKDKSLIEILELPYVLSRPFAAPPGVPADRAAALQKAFLETHKDPAYLKDAERLGIDVSPVSGDDVLKLINEIAATPPELLKSVEKYIASGG